MYPFGGILIGLLTTGYVTSVVSRFSLRRGTRPGWGAVTTAVLSGVFAAWFGSFQIDLFRTERWGNASIEFMIVGIASALFGLFAACGIVDHYRKTYDRQREKT